MPTKLRLSTEVQIVDDIDGFKKCVVFLGQIEYLTKIVEPEELFFDGFEDQIEEEVCIVFSKQIEIAVPVDLDAVLKIAVEQ